MLSIECETFSIEEPDEFNEFSAKLYGELTALIETREGKVVKFENLKQVRRVVNDLVVLAEKDNNHVFVDKVKKSQHRRVYVRPMSEFEKD